MKKIDFKKNIGLSLVLGLLMLQNLSCKKFLEVQPRDYMFEEEAFSSKKGVESVLNGLYFSLADTLSYGNMLTLDVTERMAQYYTNRINNTAEVASTEIPLFASIWKKNYQTILGVNTFCDKLKAPNFSVLPAEERNILLGEAYGLRAFLHFDMLRLFGPVYVKSPSALAIPYARKSGSEVLPLSTANTVVTELLKDLDSALVLLDKDPVRTKGPDKVAGSGESIGYFTNRHRRMNYFAVKALSARVLLYAGKRAEAWQAVSSMLSQADTFFPWQTEQELAKDPMMSKETFFGIENRKLYDYYRQMFSPLLRDAVINTPKPPRLDGIYNPNSTDLRLKYWFKIGVEGDKNYKVFIKHSNVTITDQAIRYYQPLIRKSELYLIAAESAPDLQQGYFYLNVLRANRGLPAIAYQPGSTTADLISVISAEYEREFIGEGQTFFMFKRLNASEITDVTGWWTNMMTDLQYVPALPQEEKYYR